MCSLREPATTRAILDCTSRHGAFLVPRCTTAFVLGAQLRRPRFAVNPLYLIHEISALLDKATHHRYQKNQPCMRRKCLQSVMNLVRNGCVNREATDFANLMSAP